MHNPSLLKEGVVGHSLQMWKSADAIIPGTRKSSIRRFSFFKPSAEKTTTPTVLTTYTINKEYDPGTGNKIINNFMIIKEIGRGMHGKVKLAQDLDTSEYVVRFNFIFDRIKLTLFIYRLLK